VHQMFSFVGCVGRFVAELNNAVILRGSRGDCEIKMLNFLALSSLLLVLSWRDCFCQVAANSSGGDVMCVDLLVAVLVT
jgi:hypothetical protein